MGKDHGHKQRRELFWGRKQTGERTREKERERERERERDGARARAREHRHKQRTHDTGGCPSLIRSGPCLDWAKRASPMPSWGSLAASCSWLSAQGIEGILTNRCRVSVLLEWQNWFPSAPNSSLELSKARKSTCIELHVRVTQLLADLLYHLCLPTQSY